MTRLPLNLHPYHTKNTPQMNSLSLPSSSSSCSKPFSPKFSKPLTPFTSPLFEPACGGEIGSLTRPALNTEEMEDVEEKGGTGPSCVSGFDVFEVDVAGKRSGGGGGEEGLDLGEVGGGGIG
ncbi:hypothetical protein MtrunA17_Chr1g0180841 [Medicago truncatula]|uniref:Uncharacterized protein n=1 Tax=Medicago truncatula TaxID=3880 RepID=A0A396JSK0_MEDTR|nr:hypothetical protein MtrunA17_Chr1g0180841 [Medicago truncatula]